MAIVIEEFEVALQGPSAEATAAAAAGAGQATRPSAPIVLQDAIETLLAREAERDRRLSDA